MAASLPLSTASAPLLPAVPAEVGPVGVSNYYARARAGLPAGPDPDVLAEYVLFPSLRLSFLILRVVLRVAGLAGEVSVRVLSCITAQPPPRPGW